VLEQALAGERTPFEENTPPVLLGLRAAAPKHPSAATARAKLDQRRQEEIQKANELDESRRHSDVYGEHKRRLCALALAYQADPRAGTPVKELLDLALSIPRGFAGFMYKAWLTLYETLTICGWQNHDDLDRCLNEAFRCAHKIQDPNFCVLATARMRTMRDGWLAMVPDRTDIKAVVDKFAREPLSPTFAPLHVVADDYGHRGEDGGGIMALPKPLTEANTLWHISEQLGLSLEGMMEVNDDLKLSKDTPIPFGTVVRLHDPDFCPLVAQRLSAEVLVSKLQPREKRGLVQMLIPHALPSRTPLDTVLARLLFAAQPVDFDALDVPIPGAEPRMVGEQYVEGVR
jgi:hypothetical protein